MTDDHLIGFTLPPVPAADRAILRDVALPTAEQGELVISISEHATRPSTAISNSGPTLRKIVSLRAPTWRG